MRHPELVEAHPESVEVHPEFVKGGRAPAGRAIRFNLFASFDKLRQQKGFPLLSLTRVVIYNMIAASLNVRSETIVTLSEVEGRTKKTTTIVCLPKAYKRHNKILNDGRNNI